MKKFVILLFLIGGLTGCQSTQHVEGQPEKTAKVLADKTQIDKLMHLVAINNKDGIIAANYVPKPDELVSLNESQRQAFLAFYNSKKNQHIPEYKRLRNYLVDLYPKFDYLGRTFVAEEALQGQHGNCMSLALITTALANVAGVELQYQRINNRPIYSRYGNLMTLSSHVRSYLLDTPEAHENQYTIVPSRVIIDYYPNGSNIVGDMISENYFFSMYYRNLASEAIIQQDLERAYALMYQALILAPTDTENINTMAVVLNRKGYQQKALDVYTLGAELPKASLMLLANYASLLNANGHVAKAEQLMENISEAYEDNPYMLIDAAQTQAKRGRVKNAVRMLQRAIDDAPYLHEAYFALAKILYQSGRHGAAFEALTKAQELAYLPETRKLYAAKQSVLAGDKRERNEF